MVQRIGEIQPGAQPCQGLFDCGAVFELEGCQVQQCVKDKPNLISAELVKPPQHPLQFQNHGFGQKQVLARFDQLAGQHVGIQADHGCNNVAGSKSLGTGGMVVFSRPKPLAVGLLAGRAGLISR
jgi:hypothetical protein